MLGGQIHIYKYTNTVWSNLQIDPSSAIFLASPDALEVIVVSYSLTESVSVSTDLTDVTLVSDDTY